MHGHNHPENSNISKDSPGPDGIRSDLDKNKQNAQVHAYQVTFAGSSPESDNFGDQLMQATSNYFIGNDPSKWKTGVRSYKVITYKNMYPMWTFVIIRMADV